MPEIADDHHLMRFVPYKAQIRDAESGEFQGILTIAFAIRPEDKGGLSMTWAEHYGAYGNATLAKAGKAFKDSLPSQKLGKQAYFAMGRVDATRETSARYGKKIRLVRVPDGPNTGHVEIHRFSDDDRALLDALVDVYMDHVSVVSLGLA